jgi:hypothetical protein
VSLLRPHPKKTAEGIQRAVTELERATQYGHTPADFALAWLSEAGDEIHSKLVKHGLATARPVAASTVVTLGGLVERYQARPKWKTLKPSTQLMITRAIYHLLQHIDPTTPIAQITAADAQDFYSQLRLSKADGGAGLAVATANLTASIVAAMFFYAVDAELIDRNHFKKLPRGTRPATIRWSTPQRAQRCWQPSTGLRTVSCSDWRDGADCGLSASSAAYAGATSIGKTSGYWSRH